jgi:hypothetical protein
LVSAFTCCANSTPADPSVATHAVRRTIRMQSTQGAQIKHVERGLVAVQADIGQRTLRAFLGRPGQDLLELGVGLRTKPSDLGGVIRIIRPPLSRSWRPRRTSGRRHARACSRITA